MDRSRGEVSAATTADELQALAGTISALTQKLQKTPGLAEGHIERVAASIEQILRDYGGASYRQYRNLVRDLDAAAAEVARYTKAGTIGPRVIRIFDAALLRIRKRDFFLGRRLVDKLGKLRAQARERDRLLGEYREGYRGIERDIARLRAERDRLKSVRRPPMAESDVARVKQLLEDANRALVKAWVSELHDVPSRIAIATLLEAATERKLLLPTVPEPEATALLNLLNTDGPTREGFGNRGVHGLLEALSYSDAKLAHLIGDGRPLKAALQANLTWLKVITAPTDPLPRLSLDLPIEDLRDRVGAIAPFAARLHAASDVQSGLSDIARRLTSGEIARAQEADRAFRTHGDDARKAWEGTLEGAIRAIEHDIESKVRDLSGLRPQERLV